jgi:hypothetical protein
MIVSYQAVAFGNREGGPPFQLCRARREPQHHQFKEARMIRNVGSYHLGLVARAALSQRSN